MRARHACLSRRAPRFILAGALGSPRGASRVSDCVRQADAGRVAGAGPGLGPPPLPLFSHAAPQAPACVSRSRGPGASAPSPARTFSRARSHAAASASTLWLRDDGLGRVPAAGPSARGGQTLPRPAGGQLYEQQQGRRLPPTPADPGALPLPEGGGTLGRPLRCPPRARGSTGGSGLAARRLPLAPAPEIRCPAPASGQEQHVFSGGRRGGSSF